MKTNPKMSSLAEQVHSLCQNIPKGKVTTYKNIGEALGVRSYRAIGQALRRSPGMPFVPCHRVICSNGSLGGFKGKLGGKEIGEKRRLLEKEGVRINESKVDLPKYKWRF